MSLLNEIEKEIHDLKDSLRILETIKYRLGVHIDKLVEIQLKHERGETK
jgi:hypothetical protein